MKTLIVASLTILTIVFTTIALAQSSGGNFEITNWTIDNGGGTSSGGQFTVTGTIGQPDANPQISTGGTFSVAGGFWARAEIINLLFEDSFENN